MTEAADHIVEAERFYRPIIVGPPARLVGGQKLWRQFEDARDSYLRGATDFQPVYERINEMAVAHELLTDTTLAETAIAYEPPIAADGSLIDFVASWPDGRTLYLEVKTVHPRTTDGEESWSKFENRRGHHPDHVAYIVHKDWLGGQIYGDSFSARGAFMTYARQFEDRLSEAITTHNVLYVTGAAAGEGGGGRFDCCWLVSNLGGVRFQQRNQLGRPHLSQHLTPAQIDADSIEKLERRFAVS